MIVGCSGWIIWLWNDKILVKKKKKSLLNTSENLILLSKINSLTFLLPLYKSVWNFCFLYCFGNCKKSSSHHRLWSQNGWKELEKEQDQKKHSVLNMAEQSKQLKQQQEKQSVDQRLQANSNLSVLKTQLQYTSFY